MNLASLRADREPTAELQIGDAVPLLDADIAMLTELSRDRVGAGKLAPLQRITNRHHALARMIASGSTNIEAGIVTGYAQITVTNLLSDPSFQELVTFYAGEANDEYRSFHNQLAGLGEDALQELRRRVEESPTELGAGFLLDVITKTADRTGNGPSTKTTQEINVNIGLADRLANARKRAQLAMDGVMRDITPPEPAE